MKRTLFASSHTTGVSAPISTNACAFGIVVTLPSFSLMRATSGVISATFESSRTVSWPAAVISARRFWLPCLQRLNPSPRYESVTVAPTAASDIAPSTAESPPPTTSTSWPANSAGSSRREWTFSRFAPGTARRRGLPRSPVASTTRRARYVATVVVTTNVPSSPRFTVSTASPSFTGRSTPATTRCHAATSSSLVPSNTGRNETFAESQGSAMNVLPFG